MVMDIARRLEIPRVVHIGTDEVYGSVEIGSSKETDPLEPDRRTRRRRPAPT